MLCVLADAQLLRITFLTDKWALEEIFHFFNDPYQTHI